MLSEIGIHSVLLVVSSPDKRYIERTHLETARSVPRGSDACHNCSVAHSLRAPIQERSPCPNALPAELPPELRPNALLPEFIPPSASLRIRRRSSVWRDASIRPPKAGAQPEPTASSSASRPWP